MIPEAIDQGAVNNCVANAINYGFAHHFGKVFDPNWLHGKPDNNWQTNFQAYFPVLADYGNLPVGDYSERYLEGYLAKEWVAANKQKFLAITKNYKIRRYKKLNTPAELLEAVRSPNWYVVFSTAIKTHHIDADGIFRPMNGTDTSYVHALSVWEVMSDTTVKILNSWGSSWGKDGQALMYVSDVLKGKDCWAYSFKEGDGGMRKTKYVEGLAEGRALVVRDSADPRSSTVGTLTNGETVVVLDEQNGRSFVSTGTAGWVSNAYLTDKSRAAKSDMLPPEPEDQDAKLQWYLHKWGFGPLVGDIDGKIGSKTKTAVKQFQAAMGLTADGIAGTKTWAALAGDVIVPRITETDMACQCGKFCDGFPNPCTTGIRILIERIWREVEKKHPGVVLYVTNNAHPAPDGATAGGQRCEEWNRLREGAAGSQHLKGTAADIYGRLDGVNDAELRQEIEDIAMRMNTEGGVGYDATYIVHVDVRGKKSRWKY